jgi:cytidylate kinase
MVTISRQAGAGGDEIARLLAEELGWRVLDNEVLEGLLMESGFPQVEVETFTERRPGLWHRFSTEKNRYLHFLKLASYEFARQGSCIIVGRGGQVLFGNVPGILRVRVIAPQQDRVLNVRKTFGDDERRARQAVQHSDNERAGFYRFLFHTNWDCLELYDLIINTHLISVKTATDLIIRTLAAKETAERKKETSAKLEDLYLSQKAIVAILFEQKLPIHFLEIEVDNGVITLKGTARDHPSIERCQEVAAGVFNMNKINNEICFAPKYVEVLAGIHRGTADRRAG